MKEDNLMPISENMVQEIVQEVMAKMQIADAPAGKHGIFKDMNDAIEAAKKSQAIVKKMSMDQREKILTCIRKKIRENAEVLSRLRAMGLLDGHTKAVITHFSHNSAPTEEKLRRAEGELGVIAAYDGLTVSI